MYSLINSTFLLILISLSSCSIARPAWIRQGVAPVPEARINWPRPSNVGSPQSGQYAIGRHDGTHSTHNYKHANKAAHARRLAGGGGIKVSYPQPGLAHGANYKTPVPGLHPVGGVVVNHRLQTDLAGSNYKMPRSAGQRRLNSQRFMTDTLPGKPAETLNRLTPVLPLNPSINPIN